MVTPFRLAAPFAAFAGDERRRANRTCTPSDCGRAAATRRTAGKDFLSREEWRRCRQGKNVESSRFRTGTITHPIDALRHLHGTSVTVHVDLVVPRLFNKKTPTKSTT